MATYKLVIDIVDIGNGCEALVTALARREG